MLRRMLPQDSESEGESEDRDGKEAHSEEKGSEKPAENGVEEKEGSSKTNQSFPGILIPHYTEEFPGETIEKAKKLKHLADKAECLTTKVQSYLSAIGLFIKSSLVDINISQDDSIKVLKQTHNLTKFVTKLCKRKVKPEDVAKQLSIYSVLVLRAQLIIDRHLGQQDKGSSNAHPVPVSDPRWKQADQLVSQNDCIKDTFAVLELECGSLTPQSSLAQLVGYLETALQKLSQKSS